MTKDEQRRALKLLHKLKPEDEHMRVELEAFLQAVGLPPEPNPDRAVERVQKKYAAWLTMAVAEIAEAAANHPSITADDLRHLTPPSKGCMAAAFRRAARLGIIRAVELCRTERTTGHLLHRWELVPADVPPDFP
jgi:hypothetical protein